MKKQLLEFQTNIFNKIKEQAKRIELKIDNETKTMTKDTYGPLPEFDNSLMWPLPEAIPLHTPPKGRSHKKADGKRLRSSPNKINSSMELSPKRCCLNASSSENYITNDETEITVEKAIEMFEKVTGRCKKKN